MPAMRRSPADCSIVRGVSRAMFYRRHCADFVIEASKKHQSPRGRWVQSLAVPV